MSAELPAADLEPLYDDGVDSVGRITADWSDDDWGQRACGHWSGTQTARHLLAVARWYHEWLDRAIAGDASLPFSASDMDQRNEEALAEIGDISGPEAVAAFADRATAYFQRATDHWDLPFGYPYGTVTVGLHAGVAASEWHIHAWDLSHAAEDRHRPQDPEGLFTAAGLCVAAAQGGVRGRLLRTLVPIGSRRDPWPTMLKRSGRIPTESDAEIG